MLPAAPKASGTRQKSKAVKLDEIDRLCSLLLLTQQPVASDMRFIVSVMNIVVDMERIGDQVRDIAETAGKCKSEIHVPELDEMAADCEFMIRGALESFVGRDLDRAEKIIARDDAVDTAFDKLKLKLSDWVKSGYDVEDLLNLLMIGKYLERIGDHATNIAEWTSYVVTGNKKPA